MREIKFRVWSQTHKRMGTIVNMSFENGKPVNVYAKYDLTGEEKLLKSVFNPKEIHVPMQYTGIKDKNGKEIYEGDIIKGKFNEMNDDFKCSFGVVKWIPHAAMYWVYDLKEDNFVTFEDIHCNEEIMTVEKYTVSIVGNIYENPELLQD